MFRVKGKIFTAFMLVLAVLMLQVCASAELNLDVTFDENGFISDVEDWYYFGYTYGGVTFVVPTDSYSYPLDDAQKEAGIILVTGNADYTLQLRSFEPEVMTYKDLKQQMKKEITAEVHTEEREGKEVLFYRNKYPTEVSELYGIGLEGLDGKLYKISIFTGEKEEYKKDAVVWKIADIIAKSARNRDFSEWGISDQADGQ
jgi:hypothetical protein